MKYWLLKSEPGTYSWDDLVKLGNDHWDGVRNYQARNNMRAMQVGDQCIFYHSVKNPTAVGICEVTKTAYVDHTFTPEAGKNNPWEMVEIKPVRKLKREISLKEIKEHPALSEMVLVNNSRLSVQPISDEEWHILMTLAE